jgi:hypothetical protein
VIEELIPTVITDHACGPRGRLPPGGRRRLGGLANTRTARVAAPKIKKTASMAPTKSSVFVVLCPLFGRGASDESVAALSG